MSNSLVLLSLAQEQCLTFFRPDDEDYYLGYRFWEGALQGIEPRLDDYLHQPRSSAPPTKFDAKKPLLWDDFPLQGRDWLRKYDDLQSAASKGLKFSAFEDGSARVLLSGYEPGLMVEILFQPQDDGVHLQMNVSTSREIGGGSCLQQCLRFTGAMNAAWRTRIAHVPFLSEFDMHAMGRPNATLTCGRENGDWSQLPVEYTVIPTTSHSDDSGEKIKKALDHGLIVRESPHRQEAPQWYWQRVAPGTEWEQISAGMFWERTALVSNRHPADCVHAWVDIGPLAEGETRIIQGKVYYIEGSKDELLSHWRRDFSVAS